MGSSLNLHMETHQGFPCVDMSCGSAAGNKHELFSSTATFVSSSNDPHSSISSSPPNHADPAMLQAEQRCSKPLPPAPAILYTRIPRAEVLKSVKDSISHSMMLQKLRESEWEHQKDASLHKKTVRKLSKDLYLIVSWYAVLQGVLFTAVAQSSVFTCADFWGPVGIVCIVTGGTIKAAIDKLRHMEQEKTEAKKFHRRQSAVYDKIELLQWRGSACSIESLEPASRDSANEGAGNLCSFSAQGWLVLGFLAGFSVLMIFSCARMLCSSCRCKS